MQGGSRRKRIPFTNGDEQDFLTGWRKWIKYKSREAGHVKRGYRRRERRIARLEVFRDCN